MKTIILYWMRWTGKSTVWKLLAKDLSYSFLDLDTFISKKNNQKLSDYINQVWWDEFRNEEYRCLQEVLELENDDWRVIALWWWTIVFERNRDEIYKNKDTKIVYLYTELDEIAKRILKDEQSWKKRNSLTGNSVLNELKEVYNERKKIYENSCDFSVDNNGKIEKTVTEIAYKLTWGGICVPIIDFNNIFEIYNDITNDRRIEYVELRIDFLNDYSQLEDYIKKCPKKVVCTNRASFEWWDFNWTAEESFNILQKCITYWADYIDIELKSYTKISNHSGPIIATEKLILSHHNFNKTPDITELKKVLDQMNLHTPAVYKIACMPENYKDVEKIYQLQEYFNKKFHENKSVFISMWELWLQIRVNIPRIWGLFTFGSYETDISAPWQIDYKKLYNRIFNEKKLFHKNIHFYENATLENNKSLSINWNKRVLFLWASQISGSLSPFMHNFCSNLLITEEKKFFYTLVSMEKNNNPVETIVTDFIEYLEHDDMFLWANITMPYKVDVYNYLRDRKCLDDNALLVWAVNTLYKQDWKIRWTNTDIDWIFFPIKDRLEEELEWIEKCYILWSGWAARSAISAAIKLWIQNIYVLSRGQKSLDEIRQHFSTYLWEDQILITKIYDVLSGWIFPIEILEREVIIINTLPFGFKTDLPESPINFWELEKIYWNIALYYETVYDREKWDTPIVSKIEKYNTSNKKIKICRWVDMLINQAKTWFELWTWWEFQTQKIKNILLK